MKKIISGILGILFVVLVVIGVIICTYVFNQPSKDGESAELISGVWTDDDKKISFTFGQEGDFTMTHSDTGSTIAKGYFKIDEDDDKVKLLVMPTDRDESVDLGYSLYFFSTISYKELDAPTEDSPKDAVATCKFLFVNASDVYACTRTDSEGSFYDGKAK